MFLFFNGSKMSSSTIVLNHCGICRCEACDIGSQVRGKGGGGGGI